MPSKPISIKDFPKDEFMVKGHTACPGCGMAIAVRQALKILGKNTVLAIPAGCIAGGSTTGPFPLSGFALPTVYCSFDETAAFLAGIETALKVKGLKEKFNVVGIAGDGGTADIGLQCLSGAVERGHKIIYICYDNEAYMNTGIQRSGTTPYGAWTTTTPVGSLRMFKQEPKKDMPQIMIAHKIPYVATASPAFPSDLAGKIKRAMEIGGPAYIHIHTPCPTGWRFPPEKTIEVARLAVLSGMWILYEVENGVFKLNVKISKRKPVKEYLSIQGRFRHLTAEDLEKIQKEVDENCKRVGM